ncbi:unnamed protein product [Arabidopsis halleri]
MLKRLERYQKYCSYGSIEVNNKPAKELDLEDMIGVRHHHIGGAWEGTDQQNVAYMDTLRLILRDCTNLLNVIQRCKLDFKKWIPKLCCCGVANRYSHPVVCSEQMAVTTQGQSPTRKRLHALAGCSVIAFNISLLFQDLFVPIVTLLIYASLRQRHINSQVNSEIQQFFNATKI